jgi:hypothetical protein
MKPVEIGSKYRRTTHTDRYFTHGEVYEVVRFYKQEIVIIDDNENAHYASTKWFIANFELVEEPSTEPPVDLSPLKDLVERLEACLEAMRKV